MGVVDTHSSLPKGRRPGERIEKSTKKQTARKEDPEENLNDEVKPSA
ncbi:hypothetical protein AB0945_17440 [Streptomyces sp. NPDC005474]